MKVLRTIGHFILSLAALCIVVVCVCMGVNVFMAYPMATAGALLVCVAIKETLEWGGHGG